MKLLLPLLFFTLSLGAMSASPKDAALEKPQMKWQDDPLAQFVFFAVLEGCYRDGVQNEVVDLIINPQKGPDKKVKHCFVFRCELCHAVYEAFRTYAARPALSHAKGRNTFGKGVPAGTIKALKDQEARTRVYAMGDLVRPWIQQRVAQHRLSDAEKEAMKKRFKEYASEGRDLLQQYRAIDPAYLDWQFYGSCQACEASKDFK